MEEINRKFGHYVDITGKALKEVKSGDFGDTPLDLARAAKDFLDMAQRYYEDAKYFEQKGDILTAFAAINYSHAFLDAGARLGLFKVNNPKLFASD